MRGADEQDKISTVFGAHKIAKPGVTAIQGCFAYNAASFAKVCTAVAETQDHEDHGSKHDSGTFAMRETWHSNGRRKCDK